MVTAPNTAQMNQASQFSDNSNTSARSRNWLPVALKVSSVLLIGAGTALIVAGAFFVWPKVTHVLAQAFKGVSTSNMNCIAKALSGLVFGYFQLLSECLKMGGDIGGFCALFVGLIGIGILSLPILLTYGLPTLPGVIVILGAVGLWQLANPRCTPN